MVLIIMTVVAVVVIIIITRDSHMASDFGFRVYRVLGI